MSLKFANISSASSSIYLFSCSRLRFSVLLLGLKKTQHVFIMNLEKSYFEKDKHVKQVLIQRQPTEVIYVNTKVLWGWGERNLNLL